MSSRVRQQIRITIFFNDGTVVIYIWIGSGDANKIEEELAAIGVSWGI